MHKKVNKAKVKKRVDDMMLLQKTNNTISKWQKKFFALFFFFDTRAKINSNFEELGKK